MVASKKLEIALVSFNEPSSTSGVVFMTCRGCGTAGRAVKNESKSSRALFVAQLVERSPLKPKYPQFESHSRQNDDYL